MRADDRKTEAEEMFGEEKQERPMTKKYSSKKEKKRKRCSSPRKMC